MSSADSFRDPKEAGKVARLARLALDAPTLERLGRDLADILGYMEQLAAVDTSDVFGSDPAPAGARLREPGQRQLLDPADRLRNAPDHAEGAFRVPRVI